MKQSFQTKNLCHKRQAVRFIFRPRLAQENKKQDFFFATEMLQEANHTLLVREKKGGKHLVIRKLVSPLLSASKSFFAPKECKIYKSALQHFITTVHIAIYLMHTKQSIRA